MAGLVLGVVGAAIMGPAGFGFAGFMGMSGASIGFSLGSMIGNTLFAPSMPNINQQGPRLGDLKVQSSTYGNPIPIVYGAMRIAGNVIWSMDIVETSHTTTSGGGGGKGGGGGGGSVTQTSYTYSQSFAIAICEGEIAGIRKIWANGKLIYNLSDTADIATIVASNKSASGIHIYTGSETQTADSLIQANIGAADTPAYRGTAYVVFENLQLADFGNRMPNLEFEVVDSGSAAPRVDYIALSGIDPVNCISDSNGRFAYIANYSSGTVSVLDLSTNQIISNITVGTYPIGLALSSGNDVLYVTNYGSDTVSVINTAINSVVATVATGNEPQDIALSANYIYVCNSGSATGTITVINRSNNTVIGSIVTSLNPYRIEMDSNGQYAYVTTWLGYLHRINIQTNTKAESLYVGDNLFDLTLDSTYAYINARAVNKIKRVRLDSFVYVDALTLPGSPNYIDSDADNLYAVELNGTRLWVVSKSTFSIIQTISIGAGVFQNINVVGVVCYATTSTINQFLKISLVDLLTLSAVNLSSIVSNICTRAGLTAGQIDVTALTDTVDGYVVQRGTARSQIEQLMQAFYFDAVESDGKIKFVKRGGSIAASITEDDLAAHEYGSTPPTTLITNRRQEMELPVEMNVQYMDKSAAYAIGSQYSQRLTTDSENKASLNLAISMTASKAKQIADVLMYDAWTGRTTFDQAHGWKYSYLEPTDLISVTNGGRTYAMRIVDEDASGGIYSRKAVLEDINVYTQAGTAAGLPAPDGTVSIAPLTDLRLLDIPLLRDQDDGYGFYSAACGFSAGWHGAQTFKSNDGGATWSSYGSGFLNAATIGVTSTALGNFYSGNIFDETNSVTVVLENGSLASDTEMNVLNGANATLLGNEIIQFKNATLTATNTYLLTGLLRGRQGTEWTMSIHAIGDRFIALDTSTIYPMFGASTEYDLVRKYRGVSLGGFLADATTIDFTNTAVAQTPYAPVQLGGGRNAALDVVLNWIRRTRLSGSWNNYADVPLGEASEAYVVEIWNAGYTVLKRTISGLTTPTTTYTAAQQTTDFGGTQSTVYWKVFQMSATVGNGYETRGVT